MEKCHNSNLTAHLAHLQVLEEKEEITLKGIRWQKNILRAETNNLAAKIKIQ